MKNKGMLIRVEAEIKQLVGSDPELIKIRLYQHLMSRSWECFYLNDKTIEHLVSKAPVNVA